KGQKGRSGEKEEVGKEGREEVGQEIFEEGQEGRAEESGEEGCQEERAEEKGRQAGCPESGAGARARSGPRACGKLGNARFLVPAVLQFRRLVRRRRPQLVCLSPDYRGLPDFRGPQRRRCGLCLVEAVWALARLRVLGCPETSLRDSTDLRILSRVGSLIRSPRGGEWCLWFPLWLQCLV